MDDIRINKYLAMSGVCSRRDADVYIKNKRVMINNRFAKIGDKISENDKVYVDGNPVKASARKVVLAFYKPVGVVVTEKDEHAEVKISDLIDYPLRLTYAGRLDKDSEGLILLTNDGDFINASMRGSNEHEKQYIVKLKKPVTDEVVDKLKKGVYLKTLNVRTKPCKMKRIDDYTVDVTLRQGLNRQIRRMFESTGNYVTYLKRVRVLNIKIGSLSPGEYREIEGKELETLYKEAYKVKK